MTDEVKTLAEWLLDPTTVPGDEFLSTGGGGAAKSIVIDAVGCLGRAEGHGWVRLHLDDMREKFMRCAIPLDRLTAQQALDRGILVRP